MQVILLYEEGEEAAVGVLLGKTAIELAGKVTEIRAGQELAPAFRHFTLKTVPLSKDKAKSSVKSGVYPFRGSDSQ